MGGGVSTGCAAGDGYTGYSCVPGHFRGADFDRERVRMMKRRILAVFAAAGLVLVLRTSGSAAVMGSLTLQLSREGRAVSEAVVAVYRTGTAVAGGYRLTEAFGSGFISEADVLYPELAQWLAGDVKGEALRQKTDAWGEAYFGALEEGLYLVIQEGQAPSGERFDPFVLILPWDGSVWDITAAPKMETGGDRRMPDTSDPGTVTCYGWSMMGSGLGLVLLWQKDRLKHLLKAGEKKEKCL